MDNQIDKLMSALTSAQLAIGGVKKSSVNDYFQSTYVNLTAVLDAIRIPLLENDLHLSQPIECREDGRMLLRTILYHSSGQQITSTMLLPNIEKPQGVGAAISYYRRYSLMSLLALPADDDDGNIAERALKHQEAMKDRISQEEAIQMGEDLEKVPEFKDKVFDFMKTRLGITSLGALKRDTYTKWRQRLDAELGKTEDTTCEQ